MLYYPPPLYTCCIYYFFTNHRMFVYSLLTRGKPLPLGVMVAAGSPFSPVTLWQRRACDRRAADTTTGPSSSLTVQLASIKHLNSSLMSFDFPFLPTPPSTFSFLYFFSSYPCFCSSPCQAPAPSPRNKNISH